MRKLNRSLHAKLLIALLAVCVLSFGAGRAYAKYVREKQGNGLIRAQEFYFTSDYLTPTGETYILNADTKQISFQLRNYDDQLRWSENNVSYEVTATGGCTVVQPTGEMIIPTGNDNSVTIELKNLTPGGTYTVTATGSAGYEATLQATFKVNQNTTGLYYQVDTASNNDYVLLTVWSEDISSSNVTITYPDGLVPDNTNPNMRGLTTGSSINITDFDDYESRVYRFFKEGTYSGTFSVKLDGNDATPATPK